MLEQNAALSYGGYRVIDESGAMLGGFSPPRHNHLQRYA